MSRNLIARLAVAAIAIPVVLWICYQGGWWFKGMVLVFATLAISEYCIAEGIGLRKAEFWLTLSFTLYTVTVCSRTLYTKWDWWLANIEAGLGSIFLLCGFCVFFIVAGLGLAFRREEPRQLFRRYSRLTWGVIYVGLLYSFVLTIGTNGFTLFDSVFLPGGDLMLFLFGLLWVGDTAAMWVGKTIGKHKLAPTVSPNKTIEGFVGGILGAVLVGVLMIFWKFSQVPWYHVLTLAVGCSIAGQTGDLVESMWKRSIGIKDSSAIIPGHGGVLDRFDSLLFAAPFMYMYLDFVAGQ